MAALHAVSSKAAIYSPDGQSVLVMEYHFLGAGEYGLPGGHIEAGETPEVALARELLEEIGELRIAPIRQDFWLHSDHGKSKIVLGYTASLSTTDLPESPNPDQETVLWAALADIETDKINLGSYKPFVLQNRPIPTKKKQNHA